MIPAIPIPCEIRRTGFVKSLDESLLWHDATGVSHLWVRTRAFGRVSVWTVGVITTVRARSGVAPLSEVRKVWSFNKLRVMKRRGHSLLTDGDLPRYPEARIVVRLVHIART